MIHIMMMDIDVISSMQLAVLSFVIEVDIMPVVQIRLLGEDLIWCSHCGEVDNK